MQTVLIAVHLIIVVALVAVVLLQRSEGGALGVGGGSGFMTGRGQANVLTRATAILAALFFLTSLGLTLLARYGHGNRLDFNVAPVPNGPAEPAPAAAPTGQGSVLDQLRQIERARPDAAATPAPSSATSTPAAPATSAPSTPRATPAEPSGLPDATAPAAPAPVTK